MSLYLPDNSAWARTHVPAVRARLDTLAEANELATCGMVELEVLYSARNRADLDRLWQWHRGLHRAPIDDDTFRTAVVLQAQLADTGRHRRPIPDLIIAAVAVQSDLTVLHYDKDFEIIAEVCALEHEWVVPQGSV